VGKINCLAFIILGLVIGILPWALSLNTPIVVKIFLSFVGAILFVTAIIALVLGFIEERKTRE